MVAVTRTSWRERLAGRLRDDSGFTLVELLSAQVIGGFVIASAISMIFIAFNSAARVTDRVNSAAQGRIAMETIQQRLRSQTCLFASEFKVNTATASPAFVHASPTKLVFFSDIGNNNLNTAATTAVGFKPQLRYISFEPGPSASTGRRGLFVDGLRQPSGTNIPYGFTITPVTQLTGLATSAGIALVTPTTSRAFAEGITNLVSGSTSVPFFRFFDSAGVPITASTGNPVAASNLPLIDHVAVSFKVLGLSGKDGNDATGVDRRTAAFSNDIYLKTLQTACE